MASGKSTTRLPGNSRPVSWQLASLAPRDGLGPYDGVVRPRERAAWLAARLAWPHVGSETGLENRLSLKDYLTARDRSGGYKAEPTY